MSYWISKLELMSFQRLKANENQRMPTKHTGLMEVQTLTRVQYKTCPSGCTADRLLELILKGVAKEIIIF